MKKLLLILLGITSIAYANIGSISAIRGEVNILRNNRYLLAHKGSLIEEFDLIKTGKKAKVQILFNDQGVISLGQNSKFKIERYLSSKKHKEVKFHVLKGAFKSITGRIGKIAPKKFQLKTQNATIGVRGTIFIGETSKKVDHIMCSQGAISITTPQGQILLRAGEKSTIMQNFAPSPAQKIEAKDIKLLEKVKITDPISKPKRVKIKKNPTINIEFNTLKTQIEQNRQNWGEWDKKSSLLLDKKKDTPFIPTKEKEKEQTKQDDPPVEEEKENEEKKIIQDDKPIQKEEEKNTPDNQIIYDENSFQALINRAGNSTPSYHGQVKGYIKTDIDNSQTNILMNDKNNMNLNFDLGDGTLKGDISFQTQMQQNWATEVSGKVTKDGNFDFNSQKYKGGGDGQLSGDALEKANGHFNLINDNQHGGIIHTAVGTFQLEKKGGK